MHNTVPLYDKKALQQDDKALWLFQRNVVPSKSHQAIAAAFLCPIKDQYILVFYFWSGQFLHEWLCFFGTHFHR